MRLVDRVCCLGSFPLVSLFGGIDIFSLWTIKPGVRLSAKKSAVRVSYLNAKFTQKIQLNWLKK